jgi:DNA mismatch repair ATPase MutL
MSELLVSFLAKPMRSWFQQEETEIVTIHGFIGKPEFAKKNRGEQFFFVNRFIKAVIFMRLWLLMMVFTSEHNLVIFYT